MVNIRILRAAEGKFCVGDIGLLNAVAQCSEISCASGRRGYFTGVPFTELNYYGPLCLGPEYCLPHMHACNTHTHTHIWWTREGAFELTHWSACIIGWKSGLLDILISPYIAQFMRCVIGRIYYGLKVVFCFRHFTAYHSHHDARLLTGSEHM